MELEPEPEPELFKSKLFQKSEPEPELNFSKVGTGTGTGTEKKNSYGSTTLPKTCGSDESATLVNMLAVPTSDSVSMDLGALPSLTAR
jgi:hypothetical protein